jgi:hypothetical protein
MRSLGLVMHIYDEHSSRLVTSQPCEKQTNPGISVFWLRSEALVSDLSALHGCFHLVVRCRIYQHAHRHDGVSLMLRASGNEWTQTAKTIMERIFLRLNSILKIWSRSCSTLVLLKWGFGEYYQCGYWAALENRGSWLLAAARGSNPLLSAALRDPRDLGITLPREFFLTNRTSGGILKLVLKRGSAPFLGGLIGRLSFLSGVLPRIVHHA